ncbi:MAG TPA: glycosyltransferase 87 family protein [Candidatus Limnocylindrales bacterium]|nr:glycosyltransferase 87 family protein [Candidatus Limnocylindrales bacterium]
MPARILRAAARAGAVIGVVAIAMIWPGLNLADAHAYWAAPLNDLYGAARAGGADAYLYAPAFAQALASFKALPWPVFAGLWLLFMALCLVAIVGVWALLVAFIPPVLIELQAGNIHLPLALAIGLGLRYPSTWAFVLLTKPTLGIGLLWFIVRREWRQLTIALGTTALIAAVSFVVAPGAWVEWIDALIVNAGHPISPDYSGVIHIPLLLRLPVAAAIVIWGARTDRPWTVAVAATLALPILWINGLAVLLAAPLLMRWDDPRTVITRLLASGRSGVGARA